MAIYAGAWLAATAVVVVAVVLLSHRHASPSVGVPPLTETRLLVAVRHARCRLLDSAAAAQRRLPVTGSSAARATPPGVYDRPQPAAAQLSALRQGTIVVEFHGLPGEALDALKTVQSLVPTGTILAPGGPGMPYAVAALAYRHVLVCPRYTARVLDVLRLFRGRFVGIGPGGR